MEDSDIPKALVKKIAKAKLTQLNPTPGREIQVGKDAILALAETARLFVHYVTATGEALSHQSAGLLARRMSPGILP